MGSGFICLSQTRTILPFYAAIVIVSVGYSCIAGSTFGAPLIGKWFVRKRGKALGFYGAAKGLGGVLLPLLAYLISLYGWRATLLIMGVSTLLFIPAFAFFLRKTPEECGLLPDGDPSGIDKNSVKIPGSVDSHSEVDFNLRKAALTRAFWVLTVCLFCYQMSNAALFVHLVPSLIKIGIPSQTAAFVLTLVTLTSMVGRLGFGWLSDLFSKRWLLVILYCLQSIGIFSLLQVRQVIHIVPFVLAWAPAYGGLSIVKPAIVGEYYGRRNFGTIYGLIQGISIFGGIAGPVVAGIIYDTKGSYYVAFVFLALVSMSTAILASFLRPPREEKNHSHKPALSPDYSK